MRAAHNVLYAKNHTQTYASYPAMDSLLKKEELEEES